VSDLSIRLFDAYRKPLVDTADVIVSSPKSGAVVRQKKDHAATKILKMAGLEAGEPYLVRALPMRHRPVHYGVCYLRTYTQQLIEVHTLSHLLE